MESLSLSPYKVNSLKAQRAAIQNRSYDLKHGRDQITQFADTGVPVFPKTAAIRSPQTLTGPGRWP